MAAEESAPPPSKIPKVIYFNHAGRAEPARLAFKIGGITFDDHRVDRDKWNELKQDYPFRKVPVLEVDGLVIPESNAISRYAAKLSGLIPSDPAQEARMDSILWAWGSLFIPYEAAFYAPKSEQDEAIKTSVELMKVTLSQLDAYVGQNKAGYCVGETITIADIVTACNLCYLTSRFFPIPFVPKTIAENCTNLLAVLDQVMSHPVVIKHYEEELPKGMGPGGIWRPVGAE